MAVLDKPGAVLVTRMVYVAVTVVLPRVAALLSNSRCSTCYYTDTASGLLGRASNIA